MKIRPIFTEKSISRAKLGGFSFWVSPSLTKNKIKLFIEKLYDVKVKSIRTLIYKKSVSTNFRGRSKTKPAMKKAIVYLKSGKIDTFEEVSKSK